MKDKLKLVGRKEENLNTIISIGSKKIGNGEFVVIPNLCENDGKEQIYNMCLRIKECGGSIFCKEKTIQRYSPYETQGWEFSVDNSILEAKKKLNIPLIAEISNINDIQLYEKIDVFKIRSNNMQNYSLLKAVGKQNKPVILERGDGNYIEEWLQSAEYMMLEGNENIILCESGIRTFQQKSGKMLDFASIPLIKRITHLPVIMDLRAIVGEGSIIFVLTNMALVAGADGIIINVQSNHKKKFCEYCSLKVLDFCELLGKIEKLSCDLRTR